MKQTVFLNVYRSGVYHRQGKPDTTNLHAGDVYVTEQAALAAAAARGYLMTIPATVEVPDGAVLYVNPHDSLPTPLSVTQRNGGVMLPWLDWPGNRVTGRAEEAHAPAIETSEHETALSYAEWKRLTFPHQEPQQA